MRTFKIMSIVGIVLSVFSFLCMSAFNTPVDYEAAIGWGIIASWYLLAFAIVVLVKNKK